MSQCSAEALLHPNWRSFPHSGSRPFACGYAFKSTAGSIHLYASDSLQMHTIRKYLSWVFALTSLICVQVVFTHGWDTVHQLAANQYFRFRLLRLLVPS
jgi:hypothetical protein